MRAEKTSSAINKSYDWKHWEKNTKNFLLLEKLRRSNATHSKGNKFRGVFIQPTDEEYIRHVCLHNKCIKINNIKPKKHLMDLPIQYNRNTLLAMDCAWLDLLFPHPFRRLFLSGVK